MAFFRILLIGLISLLSTGAYAVGEGAIFSQSLGDYSEELLDAKDNNKKGILLFFEMDECPWCHKMKTTVLNQPEVIEYYKEHFVVFSIDIEGGLEITNFAGKSLKMKDFAYKQNRVRATPVFAFYDLTGNKVTKYTGPLKGVEEALWLAEYVVKEEYKKQRFTKFKKMKRKEKKNK